MWVLESFGNCFLSQHTTQANYKSIFLHRKVNSTAMDYLHIEFIIPNRYRNGERPRGQRKGCLGSPRADRVIYDRGPKD